MNKILLGLAGVVAIVAIGVVVVKQQAIESLRLENEQFKQQVASLKDQVASSAQDAATASTAAASRETQIHDLVRLRAEVAELRKKTNVLAKAQREIESLHQQMAADAEERKGLAAAVQTASAQAQSQAQRTQAVKETDACINNLRLIDSAIQQWALEFHKTVNDIPTWDDLRPYLGHGPNQELPVCPSGGVYTIGTVNQKPVCNIPGHALP